LLINIDRANSVWKAVFVLVSGTGRAQKFRGKTFDAAPHPCIRFLLWCTLKLGVVRVLPPKQHRTTRRVPEKVSYRQAPVLLHPRVRRRRQERTFTSSHHHHRRSTQDFQLRTS
jgi:hypothetical protein